MAVLQITVRTGSPDFEAAIKMKKFVAGGDIDIVVSECNTPQAPVAAAAFEVYIGLVPVDMLHDLLFLEIDCIHATVTLALLAAAHNGGRNECWEFNCHAIIIPCREGCGPTFVF